MIRAVTFDHWDTLVRDPAGIRPRQLDGWMQVLTARGYEVRRAELEDAFEANWEVFEKQWRDNVQHGPREGTAVILERLGLTCEGIVHDELVETFADAGRGAELEVADGAKEALETLRDTEVKLGIVSDVGMLSSTTIRERLDGFGLLQFFDHWSFSDDVGCFKPFAPIFEHAMTGLGVDDPARIAHVGDGRRTDVAGALAMGMTSIRATWFVDRGADAGPEAHHVAGHIGEVPALLGLG
jgi:HAD superfamily hydrolase (TIGR01549 family)